MAKQAKMHELDPKQVGLTLGSFAAVVHIIWVALVGLGFGQAWYSWITGLHFLPLSGQVATFDAGKAVTLVIVAFLIGTAAGILFAKIWNHWLKKL